MSRRDFFQIFVCFIFNVSLGSAPKRKNLKLYPTLYQSRFRRPVYFKSIVMSLYTFSFFSPNFKSFRSAGLVFGSAGLGQALHNLNWVTSGQNVKLNRFYFVLNQDKDTKIIVLNIRFISLVTATGLDDVSFVSLFQGADMTVDVNKREGIPYMETFFNHSIWALLCKISAFYPVGSWGPKHINTILTKSTPGIHQTILMNKIQKIIS